LSQRVLITGGTGFVGHHLVPHLIRRGFDVTVGGRQSSAVGLIGAQFISIGDLRSDIDWNRHLERMDAVVHLAALAHLTSDISESEYNQVNLLATARLAKAASTTGVRLIFASSVAAQSGSSADRILTEGDVPRPTTPYGRSKLRAELEIKDVCGDFVILRPTLIYGTNAIGNMQRMIRLAMSPVPAPFGLVANLRSLLAVENMCAAIDFVLTSPSATNSTFLLSDREPISTRDLVSQLRSGAGLSTTQIPVPPVLLRKTLQLLGRGDMWEKLAGNLVTSVAKLEAAGFHWRVNTRDGLYALGRVSRSDANRRSPKESIQASPLIKK